MDERDILTQRRIKHEFLRSDVDAPFDSVLEVERDRA
jgi:hypothetical protein